MTTLYDSGKTTDLEEISGNPSTPVPGQLTQSILATILSIFLVTLAAQTPAAMLTVDSTDDTIPPLTGDGCSLREAIDSLNFATLSPDCPNTGDPFGTDDIINFDASLSGQTINLNGIHYAITVPMFLVGPDSGEPSGITLDAGGVSRIFNVTASTPNEFDVGFLFMTLTGGATTTTGEPGGAIHSTNAAIGLGGALVTGNSTMGNQSPGGGVYVNGGNLVLEAATISLNQTEGNNSGGGGIAVLNGDLVGQLSEINQNQTSGDTAQGGGVFVNLGDATLLNVTISNNSTSGAGSDGGGLAAFSGELEMLGNTISTNRTEGDTSRGGGLIFSDGNATLINSTISGNVTQGGFDAFGGGLYLGSGQIDLIHMTIANNTAEQNDADGLFNLVGLQLLANSLVVQSNPAEFACSNAAVTIVGSLATDASCGATVATLGAIDLQALGDNGGPTLTHAIGAASEAIDLVPNDTLCSDTPPDGAGGADQRGVTRPAGAACDAGAFELDGAPPPVPVFLTISPDPALLPESGAQSAAVSACLSMPLGDEVLVEMNVAGTATPLVDHNLANPSFITIPAGADCGSINLTPIDDTEVEADETVQMTLVSATSSVTQPTLRGTSVVTATIIDDDLTGQPPAAISVPVLGPLGFLLLPLSLLALAWRRLHVRKVTSTPTEPTL